MKPFLISTLILSLLVVSTNQLDELPFMKTIPEFSIDTIQAASNLNLNENAALNTSNIQNYLYNGV